VLFVASSVFSIRADDFLGGFIANYV